MSIESSRLMPPALPKWLLPCILLTALISGYSISKRVQVESRNKATSMAVEMETVEALAASEGKTVPQALADLKAQGVNAVVLSEESVADLMSQGRLAIEGRDATVTDTTSGHPTFARIARALAIRLPAGHAPGTVTTSDLIVGPSSVRFPLDAQMPTTMFRSCSIGLNPDQAAEARAAGMVIIGRAGNPAGVSADYVRKTLEWMNDLGATVFLPSGDQVLGRRDAIDVAEDTLVARNMLYASPEFTKIGGDDQIVKKIPDHVVRLHSAQAAELDKMPLEDAVDRYSKASRERNMRILLLRPVSFASDKPLTDFAHFAELVNEKIRKDGGALGAAHPFTDSGVSWPVRLLLALSIVPTAFWVGCCFIRSRAWRIAGSVALLALAAATKIHLGLTIFALVSAIVFPLAAFLVLDALCNTRYEPFMSVSGVFTSPSFGSVLGAFVLTTAVSLIGGFAVAGLLNGLDYFVKASEFQGIKIAVFAPIFILGIYFMCRFEDIRASMRSPITWLAALSALALLIGLAFMSTRTGNDNPAGVSDLELKMRNVLDALLFVRPRTKSFLIGHPFLFAGIGLMLWRSWQSRAVERGSVSDAVDESDRSEMIHEGPVATAEAPIQNPRSKIQNPKFGVLSALLLTIGAIGQTDVVNTFCHLHTPFLLSLLRTSVALVPGVILGAVLWWFLQRGLRLKEAA